MDELTELDKRNMLCALVNANGLIFNDIKGMYQDLEMHKDQAIDAMDENTKLYFKLKEIFKKE